MTAFDRRERLERIAAIVREAKPVEPPQISARSAAQAKTTSGRRQAAGPIDPSLPADEPPIPSPDDYGAPAISQNNTRESEYSADESENALVAEKPLSPDGNADQANLFPLRTFGFSVEDLNREFALVLMGSKAVVFLEQPDAKIEDQQRMLSVEAFNAWFSNRFTERPDPEGKVKKVTWAKAWMQSRDRRQYRGVEFYPDPYNAVGTPQYLNLWSGFAFKPAQRP